LKNEVDYAQPTKRGGGGKIFWAGDHWVYFIGCQAFVTRFVFRPGWFLLASIGLTL